MGIENMLRHEGAAFAPARRETKHESRPTTTALTNPCHRGWRRRVGRQRVGLSGMRVAKRAYDYQGKTLAGFTPKATGAAVSSNLAGADSSEKRSP